MKKTFGRLLIVALVLALTPVCHGAVPQPVGQALLTAVGGIAVKNAEAGFEFDLAMLEKIGLVQCDVKDPWLGEKKYEGVLVSAVLRRVGVPLLAGEITVVAKDGKKIPLKLSDVVKFPIILATKDNGKAIGTGLGGPIKLVFPYKTHPEVEKLYDKNCWNWYVTRIEIPSVTAAAPKTKSVLTVTGALALGPGEKGFAADLAMLEAIGLAKCEVKDPWLGKKTYEGVLLSRLLDYVGATNLAAEVVIVAKDGKKVPLKLGEVYQFPIMLATRDGGKAIGAGLGGPLKLVFPYDTHPEVEKLYDKNCWNWYVEQIEVR